MIVKLDKVIARNGETNDKAIRLFHLFIMLKILSDKSFQSGFIRFIKSIFVSLLRNQPHNF